jgi:hypothetical protein
LADADNNPNNRALAIRMVLAVFVVDLLSMGGERERLMEKSRAGDDEMQQTRTNNGSEYVPLRRNFNNPGTPSIQHSTWKRDDRTDKA